jgi:lysozyme
MSKRGIDISTWQGNVDFNKVKADGIQFCIFREGYRRDIDGQFKNYVKGAKAAGIPILGVYHFIYIDGATPKQNAEACMANMKAVGLDPTNTWIFSDLEYDTWTKAGVKVTKALCTQYTKEFLDTCKAAGCKKLGIYSNLDYYKNYYDWNQLSEYRKNLWLADYSGAPDIECKVQQTGSTGKVNGISGNVDMDTLYDESMLSNDDGKKETATRAKTVDEIAKEVINGLWGNGDNRKQRLTAAGYNYSVVQNRVNELLGGSKTTHTKSIGEIAQEVIAGKWGNGDARKQALTNAGYNYNAVQAEVNRILGGTSSKSVTTLAQEVIQGKWGNGNERKQKLESAGYNYAVVQAKVNELLGSGKSIDELAREVIQGKWGNGSERKQRLTQAGYDYDKVQARVNQLL